MVDLRPAREPFLVMMTLTGITIARTTMRTKTKIIDKRLARFQTTLLSLAKAQVNVLTLLVERSIYVNNPPRTPVINLGLGVGKELREKVEERMIEKTEERRALGMMRRKNVLGSFSEGRYLREHE
ncbi:hypothetical protein B0J14DRAFT_683907 [Halenospora varia]|nr:hypothetical protein B0J14DRAFT_683907 [Halenospora varia]